MIDNKETIINALYNAKKITREDAEKYIYSRNKKTIVDRTMQLAENGLEGVKSLWLFTKFRSDEYASILVDFDSEKTVSEESELMHKIFKSIPHDNYYLLKEVFGEEPSLIEGEDRYLKEEILKGNIRIIF